MKEKLEALRAMFEEAKKAEAEFKLKAGQFDDALTKFMTQELGVPQQCHVLDVVEKVLQAK